MLLASIVQCPCGDHARCARCPNLLALDGAGVYDHLVAAHDMGER